jgi:hypothetical protein
MEYHCSDDKAVASRIFEKGLDTYGGEIEYVLRYLGFLISINDENSAYLFLFTGRRSHLAGCYHGSC